MESLVVDDLTRWVQTRVVEEPGEDLLTLQPGRLVELVGPPGSGMTRLGYRMLVEPSRTGPVVVLDVRGWASPAAAWEVGIDPDHLVLVRCTRVEAWAGVLAALLEGSTAVLAEVPAQAAERDLRRLAALARARRVRLALRSLGGTLPAGVTHLRLKGIGVWWEGADRGHGRLTTRRLMLEASGKGMAGMSRRIEVEDAGTDVVRVVSGLVPGATGRTTG